jgi:hypothetical protein
MTLTLLRIKQIQARSCEALSVKAMPNYIESYQGCHLRQVVLIMGESFENIITTRPELICSSEEAILDQSKCHTDIWKHIGKQHRGPEMFDSLV